SLVLVGLDDITKIHVHTNDPGAVLSKAVTYGPLSKIKIDNMREQHRSLMEIDNKEEMVTEDTKEDAKPYGFVTVARGNGIASIFKDLGVDEVIEGGQTMNPSTEDIVNSINNINAEVVFVLPNNKNIIMAANQAVDLVDDKKVVVVPTKTVPQGITAITMFNQDGSSEENEELMNESIENVTSGSVTFAVKDTEDNGRAIKEGNILGLLEGKINEIGTDVYEVCKTLIGNMVNKDSGYDDNDDEFDCPICNVVIAIKMLDFE
ncbi:MAG: DAK2 domain-containing protein, partial [Hydrogenoanaerobacterium sp.]